MTVHFTFYQAQKANDASQPSAMRVHLTVRLLSSRKQEELPFKLHFLCGFPISVPVRVMEHIEPMNMSAIEGEDLSCGSSSSCPSSLIFNVVTSTDRQGGSVRPRPLARPHSLFLSMWR